jgi:hypothetical protein
MQMRQNPKIMQDDERPISTVRFAKLSSLQIADGLHVDASMRSDGDVSIAQRQDSVGSARPMYLKNAITFPPEMLFQFRDFINRAIDALFEIQENIK